MRSAFDWLFCVCLPVLLPQVAIARHILEKHQPTLIISPDVADPRTRLYCLLGRQLGIPSLEVQFGMYGTDAVEWRFFVADRLAAWGEEACDILRFHGVPTERITITGSPRHDSLINVSSAEVARTRALLKIPKASVMVVFASSYTLSAYNSLADPKCLISAKKTILEAASQVPGLCLVVKPHPLENVRQTKRLAHGCRNIRFADPRADIRELIKACDGFVTLSSTATMDALIAQKLVISPAFPDLIGWGEVYLKSGATLAVRSKEELVRSLQSVVDGSYKQFLVDFEPARQRFLSTWVYKTDGRAAARIAALAAQMAGLGEREA